MRSIMSILMAAGVSDRLKQKVKIELKNPNYVKEDKNGERKIIHNSKPINVKTYALANEFKDKLLRHDTDGAIWN